jgi:hypothetical protein
MDQQVVVEAEHPGRLEVAVVELHTAVLVAVLAVLVAAGDRPVLLGVMEQTMRALAVVALAAALSLVMETSHG